MSPGDLVTNVTTKGQVTVPIEVRKILGLKPGDRVLFSVDDGVVHVTRVLSLDEVAGSAPALSPPRTWSEIQAIVAEERAEEYLKKHPMKRAKSA